MLIQHEREKLLNVIAYFANNVSKLGKIKLFKLLYFLDFEHYKDTGRSVTGLDYYAWKWGPVPTALYEEIDSPEPDMAQMITYTEIPVYDGHATMVKVSTDKQFDSKLFSKRELNIMAQLANQYKETSAEDMIEATHLEGLPWNQIFHVEGKKQARIPYELSFRKEEYDDMLRVSQERQAFINHFKAKG